jgi:hypothetical protein
MAPPKSGYRPPIIDSFEDIGKDIARETVNVPKDIAGKIIESLGGGSSGKKQKTQTVPIVGEGQKQDGPLGTFNATKDEQTKRVIARAALEQLAGKHQTEAPDSIHEQQQKEEVMKKEQQKQVAKVQSMELPRMTSKKRRGDLYGVKGKQSTELSKNVRQD